MGSVEGSGAVRRAAAAVITAGLLLCAPAPAHAAATPARAADDTARPAGPHAPAEAPQTNTGGRGAADPLARAQEEGPNTRQVVVGAGLTGGAVLAMAGLALRRRRAAADGPSPQTGTGSPAVTGSDR